MGEKTPGVSLNASRVCYIHVVSQIQIGCSIKSVRSKLDFILIMKFKVVVESTAYLG